IRSFGDRIRWETGPNRGACAARNRGLALTEADYVMFLDADDWLAPGSVRNLVERSLSFTHSEKSVIFGQAIYVDDEGRELPESHHPDLKDGDEAPKLWMWLSGPRTTAPMHRREYVMGIGGFQQGRPAGQEWDLHVRLMRSGVRFFHS